MTMRKNIMIAAGSLLVAAAPLYAKAAPAAAPKSAAPTKPAPPAPTKPTPPPSALNCLLASNVFAQQETDQQRKDVASRVLIFYLGRVDPAMTGAQLKAGLEQTQASLKGVDAASLMNECLGEFRAKAQLLESVAQPQPQQPQSPPQQQQQPPEGR